MLDASNKPDDSVFCSVDPRPVKPGRSRRRLWLRISGAVLALAVAAVLLSIEGVDYQPYFRAQYYAKTSADFQARSITNRVISGELKAGFGRALLTPTLNAAQDEPAEGKFRAVPLAGYGDRKGRPAEGVHDDVWVKAVAIQVGEQRGVMIAADALIIPREVAEAAVDSIKNKFGLAREQIYLGATHTHCSLGAWGQGMVAEAFAGPFQPGVRAWFASRIVAAAGAALADLKPASIGSGSFAAPELIRNRLVGQLGGADPQFSFLVLKQNPGRVCVLGSFSAHATVLSGKVMEFSADYPGYWQRAVEETTGGIAVFFAGGVGSHSPVPGAGGFEGAERMGRSLADSVLGRLPQTALTNSIPFDVFGLNLALPELHVRLNDGLRLRPWLANRLLPVKDMTFVQAFRLSNTIWISTPCDFSGELAVGVKETLAGRGFGAVITSFNGDYIGYVVPGRYYHLGGYEPRLMSFFGPTVPDYMDEWLRKIAFATTVDRRP
ncbi:MAG TPA: neutral/alkaline non-lysosomal ceramidase N-terminal domain-containing protein [Verrucomicrobiae bacterium]